MAATKKTFTKKAPAKKTKRTTPKFKLGVCADGKEVELSFSSTEARDEATERLQRSLGVLSKGLQHAIQTDDGEFRYTTVNSLSAVG
jgi:hypothetical protein